MKAMQWENHKTKGTNPVKANLNIYSQEKHNESRIEKKPVELPATVVMNQQEQ